MRTSIRFGHALDGDVRDLFYCWTRVATPAGECFRREDPSNFWRISWDEDKYTFFKKASLVKPRGYVTVSLRSRETFRYGVFQLNSKLPSWINGPMLWFGFEAEDLFGGGVVHFMYRSGELRGFAGAWGGELLSMKIPGLPEKYSQERHVYTVRVHDKLALWFIDGRLRAAALLIDSDKPIIIHEGAPYSMGATSLRPAISLGILLDIDAGPIDREWVWDDIHPWQVRVQEGSPSPSLVLRMRLYGSEKLLVGSKVQGVVTAHPIPSFGLNASFLLEIEGHAIVKLQRYVLEHRWIDELVEEVNNDVLRIKAPEDALFSRIIIESENAIIKAAEAYVY